MKKLLAVAFALIAVEALAGEWHTGQNNLCTDCHTMHFSMQHTWDGTGTVTNGTPAANGNWLGATGPNHYLLKAPANQLCLACHDGQTFAPDVMGANANPSPTQGRSAGALNDTTGAAPYQTFKGHTLGSTAQPPGANPAAVGRTTLPYDPASGLECISCHTQHGIAGSYRNLGPRSYPGGNPTYIIGTANDVTRDVWINMAAPYNVNSGSAATFNPFYDSANITYNRTDPARAGTATTETSNRLDTFCGACHGDFHGAPGDATVGGSAAAMHEFIRHPTGRAVIGTASSQGYGGTSSLSRFVGATTKVKVYSSATGYTDATPGCVSCHKAHGNQNPFGLVFLNRTAASVNEEGGYATGQVEAANGYQVGYRNLCGQCHGQGN